MVGCVEGFGERDEVEEDSGDGGGNGDVPPAGAVVKGGGQNGERGDAVEENRDSKPEERHKVILWLSWPQSPSIPCGKGVVVVPSLFGKCAKSYKHRS